MAQLTSTPLQTYGYFANGNFHNSSNDVVINSIWDHTPVAIVDQADGQITMRIGKPGVALCRQPPNPFRAADLAGPVIERDKTVALDLRQMLAHADLGDAEDGRQVARTEGAARFQRVEEPGAAVGAHPLRP